MIRTFSLCDDNKPVSASYSVVIDTAGASHPYYDLDTGGRTVYWAVVTDSNVFVEDQEAYMGPYSLKADGSYAYNIQDAEIAYDATLQYADNSLLVFFNGQLLVEGQEYEEDGNRETFTFINVGTTGLPDYPDSTDDLTVMFKKYYSVISTSGTIGSIATGIYPYTTGKIRVILNDFTNGTTVRLNVAYR